MCYNQLMYKNVLKSTCAMHAFNRRYFHKRREPAVCFISTNDLKHSIILIINQFKKISFGQGDDSKKSANKNNDRNSNSPSFERLKIELTCPYRKIPVHRGGCSRWVELPPGMYQWQPLWVYGQRTQHNFHMFAMNRFVLRWLWYL